MADLQKLVEELSSLTLLEAAELSKLLETKWGVSAAAVAVAAGPGAAAAGGAAAVSTVLAVSLMGVQIWACKSGVAESSAPNIGNSGPLSMHGMALP